MRKAENGGTAFPMQDPQSIHAYAVAAVDGITDPGERDRAYLKARAEAVGGMTLRDYFAAKAMQGMAAGHFAKYGHEDYWPRPEIASEAYEMADAMLAERKADPQP